MPKIRTLPTRLRETSGRISVPTWDDTKRIRGTTLQNIRAAHFGRYPLCVHCLAETPERTTLATELDHVIPLHQGGVDSPDPFTNRQGLCAEHHEKKSKEERGHAFDLKRKLMRNGRGGGNY